MTAQGTENRRVWEPWGLCKHQKKTQNNFNCWSGIPKALVNLHLDIMILIFFSYPTLQVLLAIRVKGSFFPTLMGMGEMRGILKPKREQGHVKVYRPLW